MVEAPSAGGTSAPALARTTSRPPGRRRAAEGVLQDRQNVVTLDAPTTTAQETPTSPRPPREGLNRARPRISPVPAAAGARERLRESADKPEPPSGLGDPGLSAISEFGRTFAPQRSTIEDLAVLFIRDAIARGLLKPGERLNQDALAAALGISRMPIVAAVRQLSVEGLIDVIPHRGARVHRLTPEELKEIFDLRCHLESRLMRMAIRKSTPESLQGLTVLAEKLDSMDWREYAAIQQRVLFYDSLYSIAEQPRTLQIAQLLRGQVGGYLLLHRVHEGHHRQVISYALEGDAEAAEQWIEAHLQHVSLRLQQLVSQT